MPNTTEQQLEKVRGKRDLSVFDFLSIDDLSIRDIELILELAEIFKKAGTEEIELLEGVTIINAFYENSTRTRLSFELAGKHLEATVANITASTSSVKKGESLLDTVETLSALQAKIIVMRTAEAGAQAFVARHVPSSIVNAGDGWHEHPTQAMLDAKTMLDHHGSMKGKVLTIVGDILHSRVFGSLFRIAKKLGAKVRVSCPRTFVPAEVETLGVEVITDLSKALDGAHVVYALRVQEERGAGGFIPSLKDYSGAYAITKERLAIARKDAILMHPGPVIRDIDVASDLVTHPQSRILTQVENGLAVRKAIIWLLAKRMDGKIKPFTLK